MIIDYMNDTVFSTSTWAISDFHYTIIMTKRIHDKYIIAISIEYIYIDTVYIEKSNSSLTLFILFFGKLIALKKCGEVDRGSNHNCTKMYKTLT